MKKKLMNNNLGLKILSVFLAFFVWLAVVNISNPEISGSKEVPLDILNEDVLKSSGLTYELLSDKSTVTVVYKVRSLDAGSISASDFKAYIDLADMYEPTGAIPVEVEVKNNKVDSVVAKPGVVRVKTESLQRKLFNISVKTEGKEESGYKRGSATISPTTVYVSGPVSLVGRISTVGIVINAEGATEDLVGTAKIQCFDANDNAISLDDRVALSRTEVDYTLPILKTKNLGLNFETEGKVAEGYRYTGIESSVNSVEVLGLKSDLAGINSITIPKSELNMDGATGDKTVTIDLKEYLPEGVRLADSDGKIQVVIKVEPLETRTYELSTKDIRMVGASSQYSYQYDRDMITVTVKGLKEDLDHLENDGLGAELNVGDMTPGTHAGTVSFQLGAAYELIGYDELQVIVHDKSAEEPGEETVASEDTEAAPADNGEEAES